MILLRLFLFYILLCSPLNADEKINSKILRYMMSRDVISLHTSLNSEPETIKKFISEEVIYNLFIYWYYIDKNNYKDDREFSEALKTKIKLSKKMNSELLRNILNDWRTHDAQFSSKDELSLWYDILLPPIEKGDFVDAAKYEALIGGFVSWFEE